MLENKSSVAFLINDELDIEVDPLICQIIYKSAS